MAGIVPTYLGLSIRCTLSHSPSLRLTVSVSLCRHSVVSALKRRVSALRYASLFGIGVILWSVVLVVITYFKWCHDVDADDVASVGRECLAESVSDDALWFNGYLLGHSYTIALFLGGFAAQFTILPIYFEMKDRTPRNMAKCMAMAFGGTFCIYCFVAYFGFWTFPNLIDFANHQNLTILYGDYVPMLTVQILLALYVLLVIPLFCHSFRQSLAAMLYSNDDHNVFSSEPTVSTEPTLQSLPSQSMNDNEVQQSTTNHNGLTAEAVAGHNSTASSMPKTESLSMDLPVASHASCSLLFMASAFGVSLYAQKSSSIYAST